MKNILLLIADDLGREQLGCYGCSALSTPNIDALAKNGTRFDMAFASTASCSGSRSTIYTGLHTHENGSYGLNHGRNGFQTFANVDTAPALFNHLGYRTGILGKIHVGPAAHYPWTVREESDSRNVAWLADRAGAFFEQARDDNMPFFLTIGFVDPHRQIQTRGGFGNVSGNHDVRLADADHVFSPDKVQVPSYLSDTPAVRQELAEYYRSIARLDHGVGLILAALSRAGAADDTVVLFLSDNGPPFVNSKTTLFDAGVRLPLIVSVPCSYIPERSVVSPNLVSYVDIVPTLLAWADADANTATAPSMLKRRGRSFLSILNTNVSLPDWSAVFGSHTFHEVTNYWPTRYMRDRRFKYHRNVCWKLDFPFAMDLYASLSFEDMRNTVVSSEKDAESKPACAMIGPRRLQDYIRRPAEELFDLETDPLEVHNLASEPEYAQRLQAMRGAVETWQRETNDLWLWRDGVAVVRYMDSDYVREGLRIPDRFDFDVDHPGTRDTPTLPGPKGWINS